MNIGDIFYRAVNVAPVATPSRGKVALIHYNTYVCVKATPTGGWVRLFYITGANDGPHFLCKPRFMRNGSNFAHQSKPLAIESFRVRTSAWIRNLERDLATAKERERIIRKRRVSFCYADEYVPTAPGDVLCVTFADGEHNEKQIRVMYENISGDLVEVASWDTTTS